MNEKQILENMLKQLKTVGREQLKQEPDNPRNHFKYTIGASKSNKDQYTNSLKKAKQIMLEMCIKYNCLAVVEDSKTFETICSAG